MSNSNKNNLLKKIDLSRFQIKLRISRFDLNLIFILLAIQAVIAGLSLYQNIYHFHAAFIKNNYIQILIFLSVCAGIFYLSYRDSIKKLPSRAVFLTYLFLLTVFSLNIIGVNFVIESLTNRSIFTSGTYLFVYLFLAIIGVVISKYDYPITTSFREFYIESMSHFKKNLGLFVSLAFIVAVLGYLNVTFVYAIAYLVLIDSIYLTKAILANIRK